MKIEFNTIYVEESTLSNLEWAIRVKSILDRFPNAKVETVKSHNNIPELHNADPNKWIENKQKNLVLGIKKDLKLVANNNSSDFIAPGVSRGCLSSCVYCVEEGTLISTPNGPIPIEQIREKDSILSFDINTGELVEGQAVNILSRDVEELIEIELDDRSLYVTPEHPIMTKRGWVRAGEITENDEILITD